MHNGSKPALITKIPYYIGICFIVATLGSIECFDYIKSGFLWRDILISVLIGSTLGLALAYPLFRNITHSLQSLYFRAQQTNLELTQQDTSRRELLANAAHDIKGPLAVIVGYLEDCQSRLLKCDYRGANSSLEICSKNTKLLEKIVHEIFEAAKFDNLRGNLAIEVASIDELINDIVRKFQGRAAQESKNLSFKAGSQKSLVQVDLGLIERAISNIIDNAFKYTPKSGNILIGSKLEADNVLIYISDSGNGIPEKDMPFIFDRLYRVEKDRSKEAKGSGFGLSIVKKIVEAHAGQIFCSSTIGVGTVFQIIIPIIKKERIAEAMAELISKKK